jgi:putative ABC transport system ATP-binding protein
MISSRNGKLTTAAPHGVAAVGAAAPAVALRDVRKVYGQGDGSVVALDGISIALAQGSFTAIMGPSGSGKSTFLHVAAGLDRPTSGAVALGDTELTGLSERRLRSCGASGSGSSSRRST